MIKDFEKYIFEQFGAIMMSPDPVNTIQKPDLKRPQGFVVSGKSGAIPTQWNNSPFLAGGAVTSAFGANPKMKKKKKKVLNFHEFSEVNKKLTK